MSLVTRNFLDSNELQTLAPFTAVCSENTALHFTFNKGRAACNYKGCMSSRDRKDKQKLVYSKSLTPLGWWNKCVKLRNISPASGEVLETYNFKVNTLVATLNVKISLMV